MRRIILTKFDGRVPSSKSFIDDSAAVKEWAEFCERTGNLSEWLEAFKKYRMLSHFDDTNTQYAFLTEVEVF